MNDLTPTESLEMKHNSAVTWGWRLLFLAALINITWQSLKPGTGLIGPPYTDKILHFFAYLTLSGIALLSRFSLKNSALLAIILTFSILMEILQGLMNMGRTASLADIAANLGGILTAWGLWCGAKNLKR